MRLSITRATVLRIGPTAGPREDVMTQYNPGDHVSTDPFSSWTVLSVDDEFLTVENEHGTVRTVRPSKVSPINTGPR